MTKEMAKAIVDKLNKTTNKIYFLVSNGVDFTFCPRVELEYARENGYEIVKED